jgi:RimJ/RimL family protein N-acetyltransferase
MFGPVLRGELVSLEPPRPEYLETYRNWFSDMEITRNLLRRFTPSPRQEEAWFDHAAESQSDVLWAIVREGRAIGSTGIHEIDWLNRHAATGTVIGDRSAWGKGFGSEAVRLRTSFAFAELNLERLETESFAGNDRMHRALERAGYRVIGRRTRHIMREGDWQDVLIFELLRTDWAALQE